MGCQGQGVVDRHRAELLDAELAMLEKVHPFIRPTHEPLDWFNRHIA